MPRRPARRKLYTGLTVVLALAVVLFDSSTSVPAIPGDRPPAPSREEIVALEELARWVRSNHRVTVLTPDDVVEALRQGRRSFELFRSYTGKAAHQQFLAELPHGQDIFAAADRHGLDSLLVAAMVRVESGYNPTAVSHRGAVGLMQVMPTTGQMYGITDLTDPQRNLDAGTRYFRELLDYFSGDLELALAAYNAGPGNVRRYGGVPPFQETRNYVQKVLSTYVAYHWSVWDATGASQRILLR